MMVIWWAIQQVSSSPWNLVLFLILIYNALNSLLNTAIMQSSRKLHVKEEVQSGRY